jgi:hypothetical protein
MLTNALAYFVRGVKLIQDGHLAVGDEEQVGVRIEGDLVDLELELLLVNHLESVLSTFFGFVLEKPFEPSFM